MYKVYNTIIAYLYNHKLVSRADEIFSLFYGFRDNYVLYFIYFAEVQCLSIYRIRYRQYKKKNGDEKTKNKFLVDI